jgi:Flp pilus assembly protein TadD
MRKQGAIVVSWNPRGQHRSNEQMMGAFRPLAALRRRRSGAAGWADFALPRQLALAGLAGLALAACAMPDPRDDPPVPALHGHPPVTIPDVDLLAITPDMQRFTERYARREGEETGKAWMLAYAALDPYLLNFDYDPMLTLPADEAFAARRGNCLTFSSLFVAMARDAGLSAWYQEVQIPPQWSAVNETLLASKHVNAVVSEHGRRYVIDVSRRKPTPGERTRRLSDREAKAQYFNNLGVDALVGNDLPLAYAYFAKALEVHPGLPYLWSNLGVVFRRNLQADDAALAYRTALAAEPDHAMALNNLYDLYTEEGNVEAAAALQDRVERNRRKNPYYLHHLAELASQEGRWSDAIDLLERAIDIDAEEYRFHYSLAHAQFRSGQVETARISLDRARQLAAAQTPSPGPLTLPEDGP